VTQRQTQTKTQTQTSTRMHLNTHILTNAHTCKRYTHSPSFNLVYWRLFLPYIYIYISCVRDSLSRVLPLSLSFLHSLPFTSFLPFTLSLSHTRTHTHTRQATTATLSPSLILFLAQESQEEAVLSGGREGRGWEGAACAGF